VKRFRIFLYWLTLASILALVVLCIVGAFLGADRAKLLFNSTPLCIFWVLLAALLAVSLFAWGMMWRSPGLLAMHVGLLLILAGGIWGSKTAHEWRAALLPPEQQKTPEGFLFLNPHDIVDRISSQLWTFPPDGPPEPDRILPFDVEVRRAWVEYYPPENPGGVLLGVRYDAKGNVRDVRKVSPLNRFGWLSHFPEINNDVRILGYDPVLRRIELELFRNGETMTNTLVVGPADEKSILPLVDVFDTPQDWKDAGQPTLVLQLPYQDIRDYKAELAILDGDGNSETTGVIEVNHPLHARGYHFYLSAYDPPMALIVKAVSDDGLYWVYAGFGLLMLGVILALWITPTVRRILKKEAEHV
jgi:hypothetical protein